MTVEIRLIERLAQYASMQANLAHVGSTYTSQPREDDRQLLLLVDAVSTCVAWDFHPTSIEQLKAQLRRIREE